MGFGLINGVSFGITVIFVALVYYFMNEAAKN